MPNDTWHKHFALCFAGFAATYDYFVMHSNLYLIAILLTGFLLGSWVFNPDTFTNSASQKKWGMGKVVFKNHFWHFAHHGVSHNPLLWMAPNVIMAVYRMYAIVPYWYDSAAIFISGIAVNALLHLICDFIMIVMHKSRLPILKNI